MTETSTTDRLFSRAAMLVAALTVLGMTGFQCYILVAARHNLQTAHASQDKPMTEGSAMRPRIEGLAGRVAQLADEGNPYAKAIVENFRREGVVLHQAPSPSTSPPPAAPTKP